MKNNIYINFSAENSNIDAWVSEIFNAFRITLSKIYPRTVNIKNGLESSIASETRFNEANIIILVINGFISDEFAKDLRALELKHQEYINSGKEIFVVVKSGKFNSIIPVYLRKYAQYNFFEVNIRTNEAIEYTPFLKGEKANKFWSKITDLAYDARIFFETAEGNPSTEKLNIYLAEVSKDQVNNREILKREFLLSGFGVLPSKPLPASHKEYNEVVSEIVRSSDFSVHIMGEIYGDSPSGSDYSYSEIQNKVVSELSGKANQLKNGFYRFVWLPPNIEPYDEKQVQYLKRLKRELTDNNTGELIQCSIEEFKELIVQKVKQIKGLTAQNDSETEERRIILITDNAQESTYQKIVKQIEVANKEYESIDLSQTGELFPLAMFRQKLRMANAAILVNSKGNPGWVQGMIGLTIKNLFSGKKSYRKLIAAVSNNRSKSAIDYEALNVDFLSSEDSQFAKKLDKFLIQIK